MNRWFEAIILISICLALTNSIFGGESNKIAEYHGKANILEAERYYKIMEVETGEYEYAIFDRSGEMVYSNITYRINPRIYLVDNCLLWIEIGVGTSTTQVRFYDIDNDCLSDWFESPRAAKNNLVVIMEWSVEGGPVLLIKDIFSNEIKGEIKREFSPIAVLGSILIEAEFLSDDCISVKYYQGNDYTITEEIIHFGES